MVEEFIGFSQWWVIPFVIGGVIIARIVMNRPDQQSKYAKKTDKMRDEYIFELEDKVKHYKNKASNMERGPSIEGDLAELDEILPELIGGFENYAPKWLKPFLKDKNMQSWLIKYAQEHPDTVSKYIGKMVKSKGGSAKEITADAEAV